jgi:hypothetical protein
MRLQRRGAPLAEFSRRVGGCLAEQVLAMTIATTLATRHMLARVVGLQGRREEAEQR